MDREAGQYLGHVTTVLLEDGRTMIAVYPKGHGKGAIVMKRSSDGGLTWSPRMATPENWATSLEVPTIHRVIDPESGKKRLILFSGLYPIRLSVSEDDGVTWTPLAPVGNWGGIVAMASVERLKNGDYAAFFHDDGRFFRESGKRVDAFTLYQTISKDGGLTWGEPRAIYSSSAVNLCEPGVGPVAGRQHARGAAAREHAREELARHVHEGRSGHVDRAARAAGVAHRRPPHGEVRDGRPAVRVVPRHDGGTAPGRATGWRGSGRGTTSRTGATGSTGCG